MMLLRDFLGDHLKEGYTVFKLQKMWPCSPCVAHFIKMSVFLTTLVTTACFGMISEPKRHYYTLHLDPLNAQARPRINGLLRVRDLDSDAAYDRFQMVMRTSPFELTYRSRDLWAVKPGRMIADVIARGLAERNAFAAVTRELGDHRPDFTLAGELHALEVVDTGPEWQMHLALTLEMVSADGGKMLWSFSFDERKNMAHKAFEDAVKVSSELLTLAIDRTLESLAAQNISLTETGGAPPETPGLLPQPSFFSVPRPVLPTK